MSEWSLETWCLIAFVVVSYIVTPYPLAKIADYERMSDTDRFNECFAVGLFWCVSPVICAAFLAVGSPILAIVGIGSLIGKINERSR